MRCKDRAQSEHSRNFSAPTSPPPAVAPSSSHAPIERKTKKTSRRVVLLTPASYVERTTIRTAAVELRLCWNPNNASCGGHSATLLLSLDSQEADTDTSVDKVLAVACFGEACPLPRLTSPLPQLRALEAFRREEPAGRRRSRRGTYVRVPQYHGDPLSSRRPRRNGKR